MQKQRFFVFYSFFDKNGQFSLDLAEVCCFFNAYSGIPFLGVRDASEYLPQFNHFSSKMLTRINTAYDLFLYLYLRSIFNHLIYFFP
jgi:hypothetical protein